MEQDNSMARVALGSGVITWVLFFVLGCMGCIPLLNILASLLFPLVSLSSVAAMVTGVMGVRTANTMGGAGKGQALAGIALGISYWVFLMLLIGLVFAMGGLSVLLSAAGQ